MSVAVRNIRHVSLEKSNFEGKPLDVLRRIETCLR